jgi:salicylate hydroxylase
MAMEDSASLSLCLARCTSTADIPQALHAFETIRKPRTNMLASHSLANAKLWQLPDGPEQVARDERLRTKAVFSAGDWDGKHVDEVPQSTGDALFYPWMFGHDVVDFVSCGLTRFGEESG